MQIEHLPITDLTGYHRNSLIHRITSALPVLIHAAGGDHARLPDVQAVIDQAIADGCNDVANSAEVDIEIHDEETTDTP